MGQVKVCMSYVSTFWKGRKDKGLMSLETSVVDCCLKGSAPCHVIGEIRAEGSPDLRLYLQFNAVLRCSKEA